MEETQKTEQEVNQTQEIEQPKEEKQIVSIIQYMLHLFSKSINVLDGCIANTTQVRNSAKQLEYRNELIVLKTTYTSIIQNLAMQTSKQQSITNEQQNG